jgi:hypothetical protein
VTEGIGAKTVRQTCRAVAAFLIGRTLTETPEMRNLAVALFLWNRSERSIAQGYRAPSGTEKQAALNAWWIQRKAELDAEFPEAARLQAAQESRLE